MSVYDVPITGLGAKADGIHENAQGDKLYVERTAPGDIVRVRPRTDEEGLSRGELLEVLTPSPHRQAPPCPHYDLCGNCTLQHLNESYYREWKVGVVKEALVKMAVEPSQWLETIFIAGNSRRRATFSCYQQSGEIVMGYHPRRSRHITDIQTCLVADPRLLVVRDSLKPFLGPVLKEGRVDIFLQRVGDAFDMVIIGPIARNRASDEALEALLIATDVERISWRTFEEDNLVTLFSQDDIEATFGSLKVKLPPAAFLQPTADGEKALVKAVLSAMPAKGKFADLFSGCGTFTGPLLSRGNVDAFELSVPAVAALSQAASRRPLKVATRDLFENPLTKDELNRYDAIVFDPPRAGCREQAEKLAKSKVPLLVGISCNPATFARDARILCDGGYKLNSIQIIDQFLWSHHVEIVGVFGK